MLLHTIPEACHATSVMLPTTVPCAAHMTTHEQHPHALGNLHSAPAQVLVGHLCPLLATKVHRPLLLPAFTEGPQPCRAGAVIKNADNTISL